MKLSQMGAREGAAALCALVPHVEAIAGDAQLQQALAAASAGREGKPLFFVYADVAAALVPALLDRQYDHVMAVAAVLTGRPEAELDALGVMGLARELREALDSEVLDFFRRSGASAAGT